MTERRVMPNDIMLGGVRDLLAEGHTVVILTKGVSMLPFITGNKDSVLLEKRTSVDVGDIALAEVSKGRYVLHRVIGAGEGGVTLRGDGNWRGTEHCRPCDIAGVVKQIQHPDGTVTDPSSARQMRSWRRWMAIPRVARRYYLAVYRRIKHITI